MDIIIFFMIFYFIIMDNIDKMRLVIKLFPYPGVDFEVSGAYSYIRIDYWDGSSHNHITHGNVRRWAERLSKIVGVNTREIEIWHNKKHNY